MHDVRRGRPAPSGQDVAGYGEKTLAIVGVEKGLAARVACTDQEISHVRRATYGRARYHSRAVGSVRTKSRSRIATFWRPLVAGCVPSD